MKDELAKTIKSIKEGEKEEFEKIIDKLNPIITKYVRAIYDGDKEDIREEYILALPEEQQEVANQINRRTEFQVLKTTYDLF